MRHKFLFLALAIALNHAAWGADNSSTSGIAPVAPTKISPEQPDSMKIRLRIEDKVITATLFDSKTTQDFISLLPLTLTMNDLFGREKFARLPRAISKEGKRTHTYEVGEIAYWSQALTWPSTIATTARKSPIPALSSSAN
jgi:hypothetical protein